MDYVDLSFKIIAPGHPPRPCLSVTLINPHTNKYTTVVGIVDTGADECAFPAGYAEIIGHNLERGFPKEIGTGGGKVIGYAHTLSLQIFDYKIENVLIDFLPRLPMPLLGVKSFLSNFTLVVDYPNCKFSLLQKK